MNVIHVHHKFFCFCWTNTDINHLSIVLFKKKKRKMPRLIGECVQQKYQDDKNKLINFFTPENWNEIYTHFYVEHFSLRVYDYFLTKYTKHKQCFVKQENGNYIDIYICASNWLKQMKKKNFDPFRRKNKMLDGADCFAFGFGTQRITTTVCQLMVFKFILTYHIISFVRKNKHNILQSMKTEARKKTEKTNKKDKKGDNNSATTKRTQGPICKLCSTSVHVKGLTPLISTNNK